MINQAITFPPGLVWLASYPKSGNTWMRVLLSNLLAGRDKPADINNLSKLDMLASRWRFADDTLIDPDLLSQQELEQLRPTQCDFVADNLQDPFFCKTHDRFLAPTGTPTLGTHARAALYLVRDPRDVAVSLCHHASLSLDSTIEQMCDSDFYMGGGTQIYYRLGDWASHVSTWAEQDVIDTQIIRYEDMRENTEQILREVVDFLGATATESDISRAVTHSRLDELQRQEAQKGFRESRPGQERFFRSGRVGEWKEVLTPRQVQLIEQHCADVMLHWGYELAS